MAGAGYKLFNTGDVLTAAQVNTYLQEQAVMRFANAAARTTALSGVLAEGMVSYLMDTNAVEVYDGSAWVGVATGDITSVTAGTGLTGGGTSGAVTVSLDSPVSATNGGTAQSTYATGDLLYASATNTLAKRSIGTTGQVLTVSGGLPTWATPSASGGDFTFISSTDLSGAASYNFTDVFTSTYRNYLVLISNLDVTGGTDQLRMRMRYGSTTDSGTGQYYQGGFYATYTGSTGTLAISGGDYFSLNYQTGNSRGKNVIWFEGVGTGGNARAVYNQQGFGGQQQETVITSGSCGQTQRNYTGFNLYTPGPNNFTANVSIYGVKKS